MIQFYQNSKKRTNKRKKKISSREIISRRVLIVADINVKVSFQYTPHCLFINTQTPHNLWPQKLSNNNNNYSKNNIIYIYSKNNITYIYSNNNNNNNKAIRNRLINKITYRDRKEIAQYSELVFLASSSASFYFFCIIFWFLRLHFDTLSLVQENIEQ